MNDEKFGIINQNNVDTLISGLTVLGGGGGGDPEKAKKDCHSALKDEVKVKSLDSFGDEETIATVFAVGSLNIKERNREERVTEAIDNLNEMVSDTLDGFILGEIGAGLMPESVIAADVTQSPLVDADLVGNRGAPTICLESITLSGLSRTPLVAIGDRSKKIIRMKEFASCERIEQRLRGLSASETWYVVGYPLTASELRGSVAEGWYNRCLEIGKSLERGETDLKRSRKICEGRISSVNMSDIEGFTVGKIDISSEDGYYSVYTKNENMFVTQNNEIITEVPNNISIINISEHKGVYNGSPPQEGTPVELIEFELEDIWSSKQAKKLFNIEKLGYTIENGDVNYTINGGRSIGL
jgi:DUF917 family protein